MFLCKTNFSILHCNFSRRMYEKEIYSWEYVCAVVDFVAVDSLE